MKQNLFVLALVSALAQPLASRADDTTDQISDLKKQVQALTQKVQDLEQKEGVVETHEKNAPLISAGSSGFTFQSADTNFSVSLHGVLQVDSRTFWSDDHVKGNDTFLLRRARPILSGTVFKDYDFMFVPDFGGSTVQIFDAYINYRYNPAIQLQVGKFKSPIGLEALQADQYITFNERGLPTYLTPNRDVGVELHGDVFGGIVSYAAAFLGGVADYQSTLTNADFDNNKAVAGRLMFQPFKTTSIDPLRGLGFGVAASYQRDDGQTNSPSNTGLTQGYVTDGQQKFFTYSNNVANVGEHWRLAPQGYYFYGPAGVLGEYVISDQHLQNFGTKQKADLANTAWEATVFYNLTGEDAGYYGVTPQYNFSPLNNHWGAWQIAGRYEELSIDSATFHGFADGTTSASEAKAWSVGLNWYLNKNVRVEASYSHTSFDGGNGPKATVTKQPEEIFFTRVQLAF
jgi:phosphate-selective porin OprO/OprP